MSSTCGHSAGTFISKTTIQNTEDMLVFPYTTAATATISQIRYYCSLQHLCKTPVGMGNVGMAMGKMRDTSAG